MTKPRVLLVQPNMQPPAGGPAVSAWAAQALQDEYALDALTWTPLDVDAINRFYGTLLDARKIKNVSPPSWLRALIKLDPDPWSFQRAALMMRFAKALRRQYAMVVSLCDEIDLGMPAIQYIHFPFLWQVYQRERALRGPARVRAIGWKARPWRILSGFSFERMRKNITLVNSDWTGAHFTRYYDAPTQTLYPPVTGNFPNVSWAERENGFVCIGRFSFEKRYGDMIGILAQVRAQGHDVHLHILGAQMARGLDLDYYPILVKLVQEHAAWVTLHENISRAELQALVAQHRYGIHAMQDEHFGIAPAELVRGGCIVFVYNDGGQVEIVGNEPRLRYDSNADAVEKITRVLNDEHAQRELQCALATRAEKFAPDNFMSGLRALVEQYAARIP